MLGRAACCGCIDTAAAGSHQERRRYEGQRRAVRQPQTLLHQLITNKCPGLQSRAANAGAGHAPLRARAAAALAGAADGPPEASPMHGDKRVRFCVGHFQPIVWMGALWAVPRGSMTRLALISGRSAATQAARAGHSAPDAQGAGLRS